MRSRRTQLTVLCFSIVTLLVSTAWAEESTSDGWQWDLAPLYLWAMSLDGDVAVRGEFSPVDLGFDDILDNLDFAGTVHFEGRQAKWGFLFDYSLIKLKMEEDAPPMGTFPGGLFVVDMDINMVEVAGTRSFALEHGHVDVLFGARYMDIDNTITPPTPLPTISGAQDWTDAMAGARISARLAKHWSLLLRGDISSGGSDLSWNVSTVFRREWRRVHLVMGYRLLDVDYKDGAGSTLFVFDAQMAGPIVGVNIHWD